MSRPCIYDAIVVGAGPGGASVATVIDTTLSHMQRSHIARLRWWEALSDTEINEAISTARDDLISSATKLHPPFGPKLSELMASPELGFGAVTALAMMVSRDERGAKRGCDAEILGNVTAVLEMVNLIMVLHADLSVGMPSVGSAVLRRSDTLSVCLADCLNAEVLCRINELPPSVAGRLALALRRIMRQAAVLASARLLDDSLLAACRREVLVAAATIAVGLPAGAAHVSPGLSALPV